MQLTSSEDSQALQATLASVEMVLLSTLLMECPMYLPMSLWTTARVIYCNIFTADVANYRVRKVDRSSNIISTIVGTGAKETAVSVVSGLFSAAEGNKCVVI